MSRDPFTNLSQSISIDSSHRHPEKQGKMKKSVFLHFGSVVQWIERKFPKL